MFEDEITCHICGHIAKDRWYSDFGICISEEYVNCTCCNYSDEYTYGHYRTSFGRYEFNYSNALLSDDNSYAINIKKLHKAIFMAHRNWHKGLRERLIRK